MNLIDCFTLNVFVTLAIQEFYLKFCINRLILLSYTTNGSQLAFPQVNLTYKMYLGGTKYCTLY